MTFGETFHAVDTAGIIDRVVLAVDAGRLAVTRAEAAAVTLRGVNDRLQPSETGEKAEDRPDRTDGVAVRASVSPRKDGKNGESSHGHSESHTTAHPEIDCIEGIAVAGFGQRSKEIVAPLPDGSEKTLNDTPVSAVWRKESHERSDAEKNASSHEGKHRIAEHIFSRRIAVAVFLCHPSQTGKTVLHYAERTDDRAIDASEYKGEHHQSDDNPEVKGKQCREKLDFGQPAEPNVDRACKVKKKQRYQHDDDKRHCLSDSTKHKIYYCVNDWFKPPIQSKPSTGRLSVQYRKFITFPPKVNEINYRLSYHYYGNAATNGSSDAPKN